MPAKRKVIIDQDAFGGPNLQPILMVLQSPDVEVIGITVESGDGWQKENVAQVLRMLELVGRTDVPVVAGATFPLLNSAEATRRWEARHGKLFYKGAWTEQWSGETPVKRAPPHGPEFVPPHPDGDPVTLPLNETAAGFLVRKVKEFPGEVSVLALGPCTNLALAIRLDDTFAANARELVLMGGSFNPVPADNAFALEYTRTPRLEFNFRWDPEAASITLRASWKKITLVPIDPSTATLFTPAMMAQLATVDSPVARFVSRHVQSYPLWDELAAAVWLDPEVVTRRVEREVDVDLTREEAGYGCTLDWAPGQGPGLGQRTVEVIMAVVVAKLEQQVLGLLARSVAAER